MDEELLATFEFCAFYELLLSNEFSLKSFEKVDGLTTLLLLLLLCFMIESISKSYFPISQSFNFSLLSRTDSYPF